MATKRKSLSKKTRFEVFKRDSFKCQYCGASAPDVILEVDHIDPVSKDGAEEMVNYITACWSCNSGKSDRTLNDKTTVLKQKAQLDELNQRREQLEMMLQWRQGLKGIKEAELESVCAAWGEAASGWHLNDTGKAEVAKYIKKYGVAKVLDAIEEVRVAYITPEADGKLTANTVGLAFSKLAGFLRMHGLPEDERRLYYVKGILRNRLNYVPYDVIKHLQIGLQAGISVESMEFEAKHTTSWTRFLTWLNTEEGED
jgi:hypothetical protein